MEEGVVLVLGAALVRTRNPGGAAWRRAYELIASGAPYRTTGAGRLRLSGSDSSWHRAGFGLCARCLALSPTSSTSEGARRRSRMSFHLLGPQLVALDLLPDRAGRFKVTCSSGFFEVGESLEDDVEPAVAFPIDDEMTKWDIGSTAMCFTHVGGILEPYERDLA